MRFVLNILILISGLRFVNACHAIVLRYKARLLCRHLETQGIHYTIAQQFRSKQGAHRWSTAYQIVTGNIPLETLRQLDGGRDRDGNIWYRKEWDAGAIVENARSMQPPTHAYAEEGYEDSDPRRLPNLSTIPVSTHIRGQAIDILAEWDRVSDAERIISGLGLTRPYAAEPWHFELTNRHNQ
jgi:hypothetical protein